MQVVNRLQQQLVKTIETGSVEDRGLCRVVDMKLSRLYEQNNKTGLISVQHFAIQLSYIQLFLIDLTLTERLQRW